jgi:hypothetical protein
MSTEHLTDVEAQSKLAAWTSAVAAYGVASLVQILAYGAGASGDGSSAITTNDPATRWLSNLFDIAIVLTWLVGPAATATWFLARKLGFWKDIGSQSLGLPRALALLLLPVLSSYLGAVISANIWGT